MRTSESCCENLIFVTLTYRKCLRTLSISDRIADNGVIISDKNRKARGIIGLGRRLPVWERLRIEAAPLQGTGSCAMSDTTLTILIVAAAVVLVVFLLRERLGNFSLSASKKGL